MCCAIVSLFVLFERCLAINAYFSSDNSFSDISPMRSGKNIVRNLAATMDTRDESVIDVEFGYSDST